MSYWQRNYRHIQIFTHDTGRQWSNFPPVRAGSSYNEVEVQDHIISRWSIQAPRFWKLVLFLLPETKCYKPGAVLRA